KSYLDGQKAEWEQKRKEATAYKNMANARKVIKAIGMLRDGKKIPQKFRDSLPEQVQEAVRGIERSLPSRQEDYAHIERLVPENIRSSAEDTIPSVQHVRELEEKKQAVEQGSAEAQ